MERAVTRTTLHAGNKDLQYWLAQPVEARIAALEMLRAEHIRTLPDADQRLQRVCRVTQRARR